MYNKLCTIYTWTNSALIKRLIFIILVLATKTCWCQVTVTGTVVFKGTGSAVPGIDVVEKGTKNRTVTAGDGTFRLIVKDLNAVLVFSCIGVKTQEFELNGREKILVKLKLECNKDIFDSKQVHIYANSGIINNPVGGKIDITSPLVLHGDIKGLYSYQTNLKENKIREEQVDLKHYVGNCDFDIDFRWSYRKVTFDNKLDFNVNSFQIDLNLRRIKLIAGYSHLNFIKIEATENQKHSGLLIGIGRYFNIPLHPTAIVKVGLYNNKAVYQASIQGGLKGFLCYLKFYKLNSFNELSIGIGTKFGYRTNKRKGINGAQH